MFFSEKPVNLQIQKRFVDRRLKYENGLRILIGGVLFLFTLFQSHA